MDLKPLLAVKELKSIRRTFDDETENLIQITESMGITCIPYLFISP